MIQKDIRSSWIVAIAAISLIYTFFGSKLAYIVIGVISIPLFSYYRKKIDNENNFLESMSDFGKMITGIYYLILVVLSFYLALNHPEAINYGNRNQFMLLLLAILLPVLVVLIKKDIALYSGNNFEKT